MRLSLSLGLWLTAAAGIVLAAVGWFQLQVEEEDLDAAARRELTLLATAIRTATENAIRDDQEPDVTALLEQLEVKDPAVDIFVFESDGTLIGSSWGSTGSLAAARAVVADTMPDALAVEELESQGLVASAPLRVRGSVTGRLVVLRPVAALQSDLAAERRAIVWSIVVVIAVLSSVLWVVVRARVHHPLGRFVAGVRRVRSGDLSARIDLPGADELAELAQEFDAMTETLQEAQRRLVSEAEAREKFELDMQRANRLSVVGEIAATLAHEIGSPLQVLNGRSRDLATRADLPEDAKRSAAILVEQTDRVHQIVERLLDVARRKAPEVADLDVLELVHQMVELVSTQARRLDVRLDIEAHDVPHVRADRAQVQQVLLNLLQNAMRASSGGGVVRVTVFESSFKPPSDSRPHPSVAVAVDDTGGGISEAIQSRVFEPFFTAWNGQGPAKGTGLGLAVVRSIVTDHGGVVNAGASPSGMGARFIFHLPVGAAPAEEAR